jgi:type I restriction enzyme S subunit
LGQGNSVVHIYPSDLSKIKIPLPPLPEQKAIAQVLSTADTAIHTTEKLIAQKELRKKWLIQKLLTGKKRLKGFGGEWKEKKLGKLFNQIKNVNDGGDTHSIMTISSKLGLISQEDKFDRVIAGDSLKKYTQLVKGDFAYNKGNSKTYPMGCIYRLEEKESALVPFVYICFSSTDLVDGLFYKHWFLAHGLDRQLNRIITSGARGDGLLNVNNDDFFGLKIIFPPKAEQTAIALVLQAADKEISLLKAKADKLREQKKGLMQVLLTGKVRLNFLN